MPKRCTAPFAVMVNGVPRVITGGQIVADDDPAVKGHETSFEDVGVAAARSSRAVEQATAAPGEKRSVGRPRKSAAAKPKSDD